MANGADHWFQRKHGDELHGPDRLLLRRVRLPRVAGHLLRRPRRPRGRPHEDGLGHGAAAGRRGAHVPPGLLPPDDRRRRPPGARLPGLRARAPADPARARPPRRAAHGQRPAARPRPVRGRLAGPGGPRAGPAARHGRPRQRRLGPADHAHPLRPRPRDAPAPGAGPGRRRRPRPARARALARPCGTSTRATRRSCSPSGRGSWSPAARRSTTPGTTVQPRQRVHDPHPGLGRQRALRRGPRAARRRARCSTATGGPAPAACRSSGSWSSGSGVERRHRPVRHDGVLAAPHPRRERRVASSTAIRPTAPGTSVAPHEILGLTNGVHTPTWVGQPMRDALERYTNADLDAMDARARGAPLLGADRRRCPRRSCGRPTSARSWSSRSSPAAACATSSPATARRRARSRSWRRSWIPAILTIGFARRFATYKRAALLFTDLDRLARHPVGRGPAGPDHLRRQGAPGRPARARA